MRGSQRTEDDRGEAGNDAVTRVIAGTLLLFALWLGMSGVYQPLTIWLGAASSVVVAIIVWRMERANPDARTRIRLRPLTFFRYFGWLLKEIAVANWAVTKAIMAPDLAIRRHFFKVPFTQKTDLGQVIFANSITLTPGTLTVEIEDGSFWVHALDYGEGTMGELAGMDARVTATEAA